MLIPYLYAEKTEAGCDEAGRGCLAGPVFAAAVILPKDFHHKDLNDSKQLNERTRERLRPIIEREAISFAVAFATPTEIDRINILNASILAMHRAIAKLGTLPEYLLIDGNRFKPYPFSIIPHECIVKGDGKVMSIAAASILAKTARDEYMRELALMFPEYGWEQNMGYPTAAHRKAIQQYGLTEHHRVTFKSALAGSHLSVLKVVSDLKLIL